MGREIKRVPLDFNWPLHEVWKGYLIPDELCPKKCEVCDGDGLTVEARAIDQTFYAHQIDGPNADLLCWNNKIGQAEVDNLIVEGRLTVQKKREPTPDNSRDWEWVNVPRTAAEINAANTRGYSLLGGHDAINQGILLRFRCKVLGIEMKCPKCEGHGDMATPEERDAYENWKGEEPPAGEGWQLFETVSEGSPISPVFATQELFIAYLIREGYSPVAAKNFADTGWAPSMLIADGVIYNDIESMRTIKS